jgi:hypothetical protein
VLGIKPDGSPDEGMLETENDADSRIDRLERTVCREVHDATDALKEQVATVQNLMERPPPAGHPEAAVNSRPAIGPEVPQHATVDAGSAAELSMVMAVIGIKGVSWAHHRMKELLRR